MKIALVHDQLHEFGGAERVFLLLKKIFPKSDVYTALYTPSQLDKHAPNWREWTLKASWVQKIPWISRLISPLRFLDPWIWESFDFSAYDVVISSSGGHMCKGILTRPQTLHISYVHHQPRYLYYYATAMSWQKYWPIRIYGHLINHFLRMWDYIGSQRPDILIANSIETQKRIKKFYRRESIVIYPPVAMPKGVDYMQDIHKDSYYITLSRLVEAKNIKLLIDAALKGNFKLKIVGTGKDGDYLKSIASKNIEFLGRVDDSQFSDLYAHAKAFLNAGVDEEFGIAPAEAMSYGVPVIAYGSAGLLETVIDGHNGFLYSDLIVESLLGAIEKLESLSTKDYILMRKHAHEESKKYSEERFEKEIKNLMKDKVKAS